MRVLIAEDESLLARLLVQAFADEGWETAVARDGIECLNRIPAFRPDVVVMDVMMPKLDGIDTTRLIRRNPGHDRTVVVALTAKSDETTRSEMLAAGADLFLEKPFVMSRLVEQVGEAMAARGATARGRT